MARITRYLRHYPLTNGSTLLLNTLTSAIDVVDEVTHAKILAMIEGRGEIRREDEPQLHDALRKRGYLFDEDGAERAVLDELHKITLAAPITGIPTRFIICPTMACNLRCTYCFESTDQHVSFDNLSDGQLAGIYDYIRDCLAKLAVVAQDPIGSKFMGDEPPTIGLFGGEPLLRRNRHMVESILEFASSVPMKVRIITNGTQVRHWTDVLEKYRNTLQFQVTLDGSRASHDARRIRANGTGTFDEVCAAVNLVTSYGIHVALRVNFDRRNIGDVAELRELFTTQGWLANPLVSPYASVIFDFTQDGPDILGESELLSALYDSGAYGSADPIFDAVVSPSTSYVEGFLAPHLKGMKPWKLSYCEATNGSNICFAADGTITTCLTYVGKGGMTVGTFDDEGVHIDQVALDKWRQRDGFRMARCADCELLLLCGGGCPVKAIERTGDIDTAVCGDVERTLAVHITHIQDTLLR